MEAAGLTIPEGNWDTLLSKTEMEILLARTETLSLKRLKHMQHFVENYYTKEWMEEYYPRIQLKYAKALAEKGNYRKALAEIEKGLVVVKRGKRYCYCADLYFMSIQIFENVIIDTMSEKEQKELMWRCQQAYYLYILDQNPKAKEVKKYMNRGLGKVI